MEAIRQANFREIVGFYKKSYGGSSSFKWTMDILKKADASARGKWQLVALTPEEVCSKITLPWHHHGDEGDGKGVELIPKTGMTVSHVTANIIRLMPEYQRKNSKCLGNINYLKNLDLNPIILSTKALKGYGLFAYDHMEEMSGNLIHLDGLHRLIAWSIDGRFRYPKCLFNGHLFAYLADMD
jgi:Family of unknown function (DUF6309)